MKTGGARDKKLPGTDKQDRTDQEMDHQDRDRDVTVGHRENMAGRTQCRARKPGKGHHMVQPKGDWRRTTGQKQGRHKRELGD